MGKMIKLNLKKNAIRKCKFDLYQRNRGRIGLSCRCIRFLTPLSKIIGNLTIISITIKNILECMENIYENIFT